MDISKISIGKNPPHDVNVIIEIPKNGQPVKYEIDKDSGALFVDRFLHTSMIYPENYGFIPNTLSDDGDPVDVLVISHIPVVAGSVLRSRPIGVLLMEDESGQDEKILAVPVDKLHSSYAAIRSIDDLPKITLDAIAHFFERYKDLEPGKWAKVKGWEGAERAAQLIDAGIEAAKQKAA